MRLYHDGARTDTYIRIHDRLVLLNRIFVGRTGTIRSHIYYTVRLGQTTRNSKHRLNIHRGACYHYTSIKLQKGLGLKWITYIGPQMHIGQYWTFTHYNKIGSRLKTPRKKRPLKTCRICRKAVGTKLRCRTICPDCTKTPLHNL